MAESAYKITDLAWRRKYPRAGLPSYRQMDYWARNGALGDKNKQAVGSGNYREWTEHDLTRLAAIFEVVEDLRALGCQMSMHIVAQLWDLLDKASTAILRAGTIAITVSLPKTGEPQ